VRFSAEEKWRERCEAASGREGPATPFHAETGLTRILRGEQVNSTASLLFTIK
jgi:hypothetical protein